MSRRIAISLAALVATGCLRPLPAPEPLPCADVRWDCFRRTLPVRTGCDPARDAACVRRESPVRSTMRVHVQDVLLFRKWREQRPRFACASQAPAGFAATSLQIGGGRAAAFVHEPAPQTDGTPRPYIIVAYGLYDSAASRYVRMIARSLADAGYGVLVPEMPWHGCRLHDDPRATTTLGRVESEELVAWGVSIREKDPQARVALLGFSLGAHNVIHSLATPGAERVFIGGIAVSPPGDLSACVTHLDERGSFRRDRGLRLVRLFFRSNLAARLRAIDVRPAPRSFEQYVAHLAAREWKEPLEILDAASSEKRLGDVRVPLLIIASNGDPVYAPSAAASLERASAANGCALVLRTGFGGHIGHMGAAPKWFASVLETFFSNVDALAAH